MTTEDVEVEREVVRVYEWRFTWLVSGGFSKRNAALIASSDLDWRYAVNLLRNCKDKGHTQDFVMKLLF